MSFDVVQEMEESTMKDSKYRKMQEAEVAEELALNSALKRVRLEEAARSPSISKYRWTFYVVIGVVLLYFHDDLADYLWYIVLYLLIEIRTNSASVHSRIDAIVELERLRLEVLCEKQTKNAQQDAPSNR